MLFLLKRDFDNAQWSIFFLITFIPIIYILNMPIIYPAIYVLVFIMSALFYTDEKFRVNQFLVSLPINRNPLVKSRYIFLFILTLITVAFQWIIDRLAHYGLPYLDAAPLNHLSLTLLFMGICVVLSLSIPVYYIFKTVRKAIIFHFAWMFFLAIIFGVTLGSPYFNYSYLLILKLIDIQPYLIPIAISIICLYFSYLFSAWIFSRKDLT